MQIIRSKRKTIALIITPTGELIVRAPLHMTNAAVEAVVRSKAGWIAKKQAEMQQAQAAGPVSPFQPGTTFSFLGEAYPLRVTKTTRAPLVLQTNAFVISPENLPRAAAIFSRWYQTQARLLLPMRVQKLAAEHGFQVSAVRITSARTRWGSCSSRGTLNFSWRLMAAPIELIDYVILHELCHLRQANHSPAFWAEVERRLPDYRARRAALRALKPVPF